MSDYAVLDQPHKIYGVGGHILEGIGTGTIYGTVLDIHKRQVLVNVSVFVVPGLGRNLLSVPASASKGVATIFDRDRPRMEVGNAVLPLTPPVTEELYSFKLTLTDGDSAAGVALRAESANLWHRRVGHINGRYLDVLRRVPGNGVEFTGELQSCDVCALGKKLSEASPETREKRRHAALPACHN